MFSLFPSITLECLGDFRISLAVSLTRHCKVHAHLGAFTHEMGVEVLNHFGITTLCNTDFMLGNEF